MIIRVRTARHKLAAWKARHPPAGPQLAAVCVSRRNGELWLVDLDASADLLQRQGDLARWLTPSDRQRVLRIRDPLERMRRRVTYAALRMFIAKGAGQRHARARMIRPRGKAPRLAGVPAVFNLSHCESWALIGIARRGRIGVDLEELRTVPMTLRRRTQLSDAASVLARERPLDPGSDSDVLQAWTRLESFAKATGRGINRTLADFGIRAQQNPAWHTQGRSVADIARRQLRGYVIRDVALPASLIASVTRTLSFQ